MLDAHVLVQTPDGTVELKQYLFQTLDDDNKLPNGHARYFTSPHGVFLVPIAHLVLGRVRDGAVERANALMRQAYDGQIAARPPVDVRRLADQRWLVVDGNSTCMNAIISGWPDIPCVDVGETKKA